MTRRWIVQEIERDAFRLVVHAASLPVRCEAGRLISL